MDIKTGSNYTKDVNSALYKQENPGQVNDRGFVYFL